MKLILFTTILTFFCSCDSQDNEPREPTQNKPISDELLFDDLKSIDSTPELINYFESKFIDDIGEETAEKIESFELALYYGKKNDPKGRNENVCKIKIKPAKQAAPNKIRLEGFSHVRVYENKLEMLARLKPPFSSSVEGGFSYSLGAIRKATDDRKTFDTSKAEVHLIKDKTTEYANLFASYTAVKLLLGKDLDYCAKNTAD